MHLPISSSQPTCSSKPCITSSSTPCVTIRVRCQQRPTDLLGLTICARATWPDTSHASMQNTAMWSASPQMNYLTSALRLGKVKAFPRSVSPASLLINPFIDIAGHRTSTGRGNLPKDNSRRQPELGGTTSIVGIYRPQHN